MGPIALWPLDPTARVVADAFHELVKERGDDRRLVLVNTPTLAELRPTLTQMMGELRDIAQSTEAQRETRVVFFVAGSDPDAVAGLDILQPVGALLADLVTGTARMELVVLVPPVEADPKDKAQTARLLKRFESLIWNVPNLEALCVHELRPAVVAPGADREVFALGLGELLYRGLLDPDLGTDVRDAANHVAAERRSLAERKCGYLSLGARRLVFDSVSATAELATQLVRMVVSEGLLVELSPEQQRRSAQEANAAADACATAFKHALPPRPVLARPSASSRDQLETALDAWQKASHDTWAADLARLDSVISQVAEVLNRAVSAAMRPFVFLSGAMCFLRALQGRPGFVVDEGREQLWGLARLEKELLFDWFAAAAIAYLTEQNILKPGDEGPALLPDKTQETLSAWLDRLAAQKSEAAYQPESKAPFLISATRILAELAGARDAMDALAKVTEAYRLSAERLLPLLDAARARCVASEQNLAKVRDSFGFFAWIFHYSECRASVQRAEAELAACRDEMARLDALVTGVGDALTALAIDILIPFAFRQSFLAKLRQMVEKIESDLQAFIATLFTKAETAYREARAARVPSLETRVNLVTDAILGLLFAQTLPGREATNLAAEATTYVPSAITETAVSYRRIPGLSEHVAKGEAGLASLFSRLTDWSQHIFREIRSLSAPGLLWRMAPHDCAVLFTETIASSSTCLPLASSLLGNAQKQVYQQLVLRLVGGGASPLAARHVDLLPALHRIANGSDPAEVDFTVILAGFPAFAIRAIQEVRSEVEFEGLWPSGN